MCSSSVYHKIHDQTTPAPERFILHEYNEHFAQNPAMKTSYKITSKKFLPITRMFSKRWSRQDSKEAFLATFSVQVWIKLDQAAKATHTLKSCSACSTVYEKESQEFPLSKFRKVAKKPQVSITFTPDDLSSPKQFGSTLLAKGNAICQAKYQASVQEVLVETPSSKLVSKPNHRLCLSEKRNILREIKNTVQNEMNTDSDMLVLQNRLSWSKFDNFRKTQGLSKKSVPDNCTETPRRKCKHGCKSENIPIDTNKLLQEAKSWQQGHQINWTQLGRKYGLTTANCGQVVKEYLAEQGIPAALENQRSQRAQRRSKRRLPGGKASFSMYQPLKKQKEQVQERIDSGEISIGKEICPTSYSRYTAHEGEIRQDNIQVNARKIPLIEIRKKLLDKHEELGLMRLHSDEYYTALSTDVVKEKLLELHEHIEAHMSEEQLRAKLKSISRIRHLKVWHDHSDIAGHSHLLVVVYDQALYYTSKEMQDKGINIDVPAIVEDPQIHILSRSSSSIDDQTQFIESRRECLLELSEQLITKVGIPVVDVMRYFYGDGPAMQFEAGNKIGGYHNCVGCDAHSQRFDDLVYCFHANRQTLAERQEFILKGIAWKQSDINPLSNLRVAQLRNELEKRGCDTKGKKKSQLQEELDDLQKGVSNVPALLQRTPQASLQRLNLEVFPTEPLHDLKGHIRNLIEDAIKIATGETLQVLKKTHLANVLCGVPTTVRH